MGPRQQQHNARPFACTTFLITMMLALGTPTGSAAQNLNACNVARNFSTELGPAVGKSVEIKAWSECSNCRQSEASHADPVAYLRYRLTLSDAGSGKWRLTLRDADRKPLQQLSLSDFDDCITKPAQEACGETSIWSRRIPAPTVLFDLWVPPAAAAPKLRASRVIRMPKRAKTRYYSIKGAKPAWKPLHDLPRSTASFIKNRRVTGDSVGMMMASRGTASWCCSGVLVAIDPEPVFLTNFHCGAPPSVSSSFNWDREICRNTIVDFSWDGDRSKADPDAPPDHDSVSNEFQCAEVLYANEVDDIVALRLQSIEGIATPRPRPLRLNLQASPGGEITIIHHPECRPKQISFNCQVSQTGLKGWKSASGMTDFTHTCDTEGGSSGAPVFNKAGQLVGLHHIGFEKLPSGVCDKRNKAVDIQTIISDLKSNARVKALLGLE